MSDIAQWENIFAVLVSICGIIFIILSINGIRTGIVLGYKGWAMKIIRRKESKKRFWVNLTLQFILGVITFIFGLLLFYY